jgi:CBS domain-containing protein
LKEWIQDGNFFLSEPIKTLSQQREFKPMKQTKEMKFVKDLKRKAVVCYDDCDIKIVAQKIIQGDINHVIVTDRNRHLQGIVTSFDVTRAIAEEKKDIKDITTKKVITAKDDEPIDIAARRMRMNNISALPVIDENKIVTGIITSEELMSR